VLSPAETITPHPTVARRRLRHHTGACICRKPCRLLAGASTSCNVFSAQPLESYRNSGKFDRLLIHFGNMFYIGSTSLTGSDSDCASRCSNVGTAWLLDTCPSSADLSPASTDTGIYDLLTVASLTFHKLNCQHTDDMRSVILDRLLGTLFLSVSTTIHCLCLTLGTSPNISTSRPTSTPSGLEAFYVNFLLT